MFRYGLTINVPESLAEKGKIQEIKDNIPNILEVGGMAVRILLQQHMIELNASRSKHGSNHYNTDGIQEARVVGDTVQIPITIPGITRALHDIVIRPVEAKALAIPVHASAYGLSPREYSNYNSGEKLFIPKGKDYLAKVDENGELVVMYVLKKQVHQYQDKSLLPEPKAISDTFKDAAQEIINMILKD